MRTLLGVGLVLACLSGCTFTPVGGSGSKAPETQKIQISGSSTVGPLVSEIARRFEAQHPSVRIEVQTGGSSRGIADAGSGIVDIGMSSRALKASEKEGCRESTIALDGVCFIVHRDNPIRKLSTAQLVNILTGKVKRWNEVGGKNAEITMINRTAGRSELDLITDFFNIKPSQIQPDLFAGENQQGIKMVANDIHAITYMSVGASEYEVKNGSPIRLLPLNDIEATTATVAANKFPLARPLILVTRESPSALAERFVEFACSEAVHDLAKGFYYVPAQK